MDVNKGATLVVDGSDPSTSIPAGPNQMTNEEGSTTTITAVSASTSSSSSASTLHPLLVPEILEQVLDKADNWTNEILETLSCLKSCQQVCTVWKEVFGKRLEERDMVEIDIKSKLKKMDFSSVKKNSQEFMVTLKKNWSDHVHLKRLLTSSGSQMKILTLWVNAQDGEDNKHVKGKKKILNKIEQMVDALAFVQTHCANLNSLSIHFESSFSFDSILDDILPFGFAGPGTVLKSPKIKNITPLAIKELKVHGESVEYLELFRKLVESCPLLESLAIGGEIHLAIPILKIFVHDDVDRMTKLKKLDLEEAASKDMTVAQIFTAFYAQYSWNVENLSMSAENNTLPLIPRMLCQGSNSKLKMLKVNFQFVNPSYPKYNPRTPLSVLANLIPSLSSLECVEFEEPPSFKLGLINMIKLPKIKKFICHHSDERNVPQNFAELVTQFGLRARTSTLEALVAPTLNDPTVFRPAPNNPWTHLKDLEVRIENIAVIKAILSSLFSLERLEMNLVHINKESMASVDLDEIFTGNRKSDMLLDKKDTASKEPSIRLLTKLCALNLRCSNKDGPKFTDSFIHFGVMYLPRLLTFCVEPVGQFSEEAVQQLRNKSYPFFRCNV